MGFRMDAKPRYAYFRKYHDEISLMPARRVLLQEDLHPEKGIPWDRTSIWRKVKNGTFPPPDGKTTDQKQGKNFWYEATIGGYWRNGVKKTQATREVAPQATAQAGD